MHEVEGSSRVSPAKYGNGALNKIHKKNKAMIKLIKFLKGFSAKRIL